MSGSSGGGGGIGFASGEVACDALVIHTQLSSPVPGVVKHLTQGDVLTVEVEQTGGTQYVVAKHNGAEAGSLASAQIIRLIECINQGTSYKAKVTAVNGGQVKVKVEAR